ncbi:MAG: ABC transporter substrate-binding protein [Thiotrichales bacterium]|nr:ABC transporter substrate-binding protein [Thiotrichales bacterium]
MLTRRQFMIRSLVSAAALASLSGCTCRQSLKMAIHPWIGYEPIYLAEDFGLLPDEVSLIKGHNASQSIQCLKSGEADVAALTLDEVLRARDQGIALTVVLVFDSSAGADMLLARSGVDELSQLKGRRIGYERSAVGELMMSKALQTVGLQEADVVRVNLPPDKQVEAWKNNEVDAVITYEPTASLLKELGAKMLFDSRQIPETIFDVLAVKTDVLENCPAVIKELVKADFEALTRMNTNLGDAIYRIANHENILPNDIKSALRGVILPSLATNRHYLRRGSSFYRAARTLNELMYENGMISRLDDFDKLLSNRYLPEDNI